MDEEVAMEDMQVAMEGIHGNVTSILDNPFFMTFLSSTILLFSIVGTLGK